MQVPLILVLHEVTDQRLADEAAALVHAIIVGNCEPSKLDVIRDEAARRNKSLAIALLFVDGGVELY